MDIHNFHSMNSTGSPSVDAIATCPNCGDSHYESNRFNEALLLNLEREASLLRFDARRAEARALFRVIAEVRIENRLRHEHFCLSCGVTYDG